MTGQSVVEAIIVRLQGRVDMNRSTADAHTSNGLRGEALVSDAKREAYIGAIEDVREVSGEYSADLVSIEDRVERLESQLAPVTLQQQVAEFHSKFCVPHSDVPKVPYGDVVRFRWRLMAEEFCEALRASFNDFQLHPNFDPTRAQAFDRLRESLDLIITHAYVNVNLPELADGLADLDYVVEGTRRQFGINGAPIARLVHAANMAKLLEPMADPQVPKKIRKPDGWQAPDILGELRRQGWAG